MIITRNKNRLLLASLALLASTSLLAYEPENTECVAPADPGGGWDFTCRQVGKTMQDLKAIPGTMQVTNMSGGGGGVALPLSSISATTITT